MRLRSMEAFPGTHRVTGMLLAAPIMAYAIPVFPLVGSRIVHPGVTRLRDREIARARERGDKIVVCVIPLLFERNLVSEFDAIVLVDAPRPLRLERMVASRGLEETDAMNMIAAQMPAELKRARADYCIDNNGSLEDLERDVDALWSSLQRVASKMEREGEIRAIASEIRGIESEVGVS